MNHRKYSIIIPFLIPPIGIYLLFVIYPYIRSIQVSFTQWRGLAKAPIWIGLANYQTLIRDENFWNALLNNLKYIVSVPIFTLVIALTLAFLITKGGVRFSRFYRVTFFFPQVMSVVAVGIVWGFVYHPRIGILNKIFELFGVTRPISWLGNPDLALWSIAAVVIWQTVGFHMVLFIAAIGTIPQNYYEAAMIDGANRWHQLRHITLPLLRDPMRTSFVFSAIGAFNMFAITQTMTQGGPNRATDVLSTYLYERAFVSSRFGYATAIAVAMFLIMLSLSVISMVLSRGQRVEY